MGVDFGDGFMKDVYIFTDAKPYFRVKKDGKWTWVACIILYNGYGNYVIQKLRTKE